MKFNTVRLGEFDNSSFNRGKSLIVESLWIVLSGTLFSSWLPGSKWRCALLKLFGASIGTGVVFKPRVRIKFPWRLSVGDYSWIGESVWIDNLDCVAIGANVCISQGAYLCTGNHDWRKREFDLVTKPIVIGDGAWVGAFSTVSPGVRMGESCVLGLGAVAKGSLDPSVIYTPTVRFDTRERVVT